MGSGGGWGGLALSHGIMDDLTPMLLPHTQILFCCHYYCSKTDCPEFVFYLILQFI